jgi:hypothetical protein
MGGLLHAAHSHARAASRCVGVTTTSCSHGTSPAGATCPSYAPVVLTAAWIAGVSFCPLRYTISDDGGIVSDVQYAAPVVRRIGLVGALESL